MCVPPVVHNVRYESCECTTGGTRRAERVNLLSIVLSNLSSNSMKTNSYVIIAHRLPVFGNAILLVVLLLLLKFYYNKEKIEMLVNFLAFCELFYYYC